jgi:hypothetical protein
MANSSQRTAQQVIDEAIEENRAAGRVIYVLAAVSQQLLASEFSCGPALLMNPLSHWLAAFVPAYYGQECGLCSKSAKKILGCGCWRLL